MEEQSAYQQAEEYLSQMSVGEWVFTRDQLTAPDGTTILWVSGADVDGNRYLGAHADYEVFIEKSTLLVQGLLDQIRTLSKKLSDEGLI